MKGKSKELYGNQIIKKETILLAGEYAFGGNALHQSDGGPKHLPDRTIPKKSN